MTILLWSIQIPCNRHSTAASDSIVTTKLPMLSEAFGNG